MVLCIYCNKKLSNEVVLKNHQKKTLYCIKIQKEKKVEPIETPEYECKWCKKNYTIKQHMEKHIGICKEKSIQLVKNEKDDQIAALKDLIEKERDEWLKERTNYYNTISCLRDENNKKDTIIQSLKEHILVLKTRQESDKEIAKLLIQTEKDTEIKNIYKELNDKSNKCIEEIAKQSKNNITKNTNITNILTNMVPLDLSEDRVKIAVDEKFTSNHMFSGQKGVARFANDVLLKDIEGKTMYICTDPSRQIFKCKDENGDIKRDIKSSKLTSSLYEHTKRKANKMSFEYLSNTRYDCIKDEIIKHTDSIRMLDYDNSEFRAELASLTTLA